MLTRSIALALALALPSSALGSSFYLGAGYGTSTVKDYTELVTFIYDDGSFTSASYDDSDSAMRVFLGYSFNENFSLEFGYVDLGEARTDAVSDGCCIYFPGPVTHTMGADGLDVSAVGMLPLGDAWRLYGRVGMLTWEGEETIADSTLSMTGTIDGSDLFLGFGIGWDIGDRFGLTGEYTMYSLEDVDFDALTLSLYFRFGGD